MSKQQPTFSSGLRLTGLDDFITPSQACIKPILVEKKASQNVQKEAKISIESDGTYTEVFEDGTKQPLQTTKITLNDCLACRLELDISNPCDLYSSRSYQA
jgi:hypothetical protein